MMHEQKRRPARGGADQLGGDREHNTEHGEQGQGAALTVVTAHKPSRLSKAFRINPSTGFEKLPGGNLAEGMIETRRVQSLAELAAVITSLTPAQALTYGIADRGKRRVMTKDAYLAAGKPEDAAARTRDCFGWPIGAGVMMIDYDPQDGCDPLDRAALVDLIRQAAPGLANAAMLWFPSASSCIWAGDEELRGIRGQRLWLLASEAADIPRAGEVLFERLWLAGHGQTMISKSGQIHLRTIVDGCVWQPERLDFAGGAACHDGLEQRRGDPVIMPGDVEIIDTRAALPDLTAEEREELLVLQAAARADSKLEADQVKAAWIEERALEMLAPDLKDNPEAYEAARKIAERALEHGVLSGDFIVHVMRGSAVENVTVSELLDNRAKYHNCTTLDPLEPDYQGGKPVGRLYLMQARPTLHSFAHGGKSFKLLRAPVRVEIVRGRTSEAARETIDLLRAEPSTYDFGGQLALVDNGRVHALCEHGLAHHLGGLCQYWKFDAYGAQKDCDPPVAMIKQIIALRERRQLRPLDGVITAPIIRLDGSVLGLPGYDPQTRLLFDPMGQEIPDIPLAPTIEQAKAALQTLLYPFELFPFVDALAKGALLAGVCTAAIRQVLPTAPAIGNDAPIQGSGKTLLAKCLGAIAEGRVPDVWPHTKGRDDEEVRKRLFTALRGGAKAMIWDNVIGTFDSASMAGFLTAPLVVDRVLGQSESIRIPNKAMLILTGNNMNLAGDMPRRVLICRIDPESEQPFKREFALDPVAWVLDHRVEMVAAVCTLIRARFTHMSKKAPGNLASFEDWDNLVRQTVVFADQVLMPGAFGDPMELIERSQAADPEAEVLFALIDALRDEFGRAEFTAKEVVSRINSDPLGALYHALIEIGLGDRAVRSPISLGKVLQNRAGRMVQGMRIHARPDSASRTNYYRIKADGEAFTGDNGSNGGFSSHTGKTTVSSTPFYNEGRKNPPSPPSSPQAAHAPPWEDDPCPMCDDQGCSWCRT
jgi:hypothetical protein